MANGCGRSGPVRGVYVVAVVQRTLGTQPVFDGYIPLPCVSTKTTSSRGGGNPASDTNIARLLNITLLAPDIVKAAVAGKEPPGLSLVKLRERLRARWNEQLEWLREE